jgi:hypothetical protein
MRPNAKIEWKNNPDNAHILELDHKVSLKAAKTTRVAAQEDAARKAAIHLQYGF